MRRRLHTLVPAPRPVATRSHEEPGSPVTASGLLRTGLPRKGPGTMGGQHTDLRTGLASIVPKAVGGREPSAVVSGKRTGVHMRGNHDFQVVRADSSAPLRHCGCGILQGDGEIPGIDLLTVRERQVLVALGAGASNRVLARRLGIAERTVKGHISHVLEKLGLSSRMEAVAVAVLCHPRLCSAGQATPPESSVAEIFVA
ncbi:response regulator transcription factor [Streptomyces californicus]|uniref:response regulator transcription factor n=1 Tax=Streptomyces californicus TaxID=67351 RepID=UPI0036BB2B65